MFQVTTLIGDAEKVEKELIKSPPPSEADIEAAKALVKEKGEVVAQLKSAKAGKAEITASVAELNKTKEFSRGWKSDLSLSLVSFKKMGRFIIPRIFLPVKPF